MKYPFFSFQLGEIKGKQGQAQFGYIRLLTMQGQPNKARLAYIQQQALVGMDVREAQCLTGCGLTQVGVDCAFTMP
jgi:hypothetical protein